MEITREASTTGWPRFLDTLTQGDVRSVVVYFSRLHRIDRLRSDSNGARVESQIFSVDGFGGYKFVGQANYNRMLRDPLFMKSLGVTIVYVLCLVPGLYVRSLGLALVVWQRSRWWDFGGPYFSCPTLSAWLSLH
jgi:ABC-type sugar transport system permease subunit